MHGTGLQSTFSSRPLSRKKVVLSHNQLVQAVLQRKATSARRIASKGSTVERNDGPKGVSRKAVESMWNGNYARNVGTYHCNKGMGSEREAGRHTRQVAVRIAFQVSIPGASGVLRRKVR